MIIKLYKYVGLSLIGFILATGLVACGGGDGSAQDPRVTGFQIAYVKRPFPLRDPDDDSLILHSDLRDPLQFYPGSDIYMREHASAQADERNITASITEGAGDVRDVEVSYDGNKLLFALKKPDIEGRQPEEQPTWNIWEYNISTGGLRRIIEQDIFAEEGNDIAPHYLPDGRIVFSSTRQYGSKETLTNEAKPRYTSLVDGERQQAMMLHVMNDDGSDIRQITFAPVIDIDPFVDKDGKIVFSRWDRFQQRSEFNIYSINPDGTDLQLRYGAHSHFSGPAGEEIQYSQLRAFPDGRVVSILRPFTDTFSGGDIGLIDIDRFADYGKPTKDHVGLTGNGQVSLSGGSASSVQAPMLGGRFISVFPLWDGTHRSLVSWSPCRVMDNDQAVPCNEALLAAEDVVEAEPIYNLFIYDHDTQTKQSIFLAEAGKAITDVVAAQPRTYPPLIEDKVEASKEKTGILHIRSVYDYDGHFDDRGANIAIANTTDPIPDFIQNSTPDDRRARFLRLIKVFVRPDRDEFQIPNLAFGRNRNRDGLTEIIGYAPIEPDGSVKVRVPADVPFTFHIVDKNGRRIDERRHASWLQVRKGETLECNGCHDHSSETPHGRIDAIQPLNKGVAADGPFAGQDATMEALAGETMAETRTRISCRDDDCRGLNPTVDIVYKDKWSLIKAAEFDYSYNDIFNFTDSIPDPVSQSCVNNWTERCRMVINYVTHIDPLWSKPRVNSTTGEDVTCSKSECHSPVSNSGTPIEPKPNIPLPLAAPAPRIPPTLPRIAPAQTGSQLNLDNVSLFDPDDDPNRLEAYTELLFSDQLQEVVDSALVDAVFDGNPIVDLGTGLITGYTPITINTRPGAPMIAGSANASRFFQVFADTADPIHYDPVAEQPILSPAELKLISEWLDIGAQYYNDPFAVPN